MGAVWSNVCPHCGLLKLFDRVYSPFPHPTSLIRMAHVAALLNSLNTVLVKLTGKEIPDRSPWHLL